MLALRYTFFDKALDNSEDSFVNNVTGFSSSWNDISTNKDLSSPTSPYRYYTEADLVTGVSVTFKDRFNLTTSLTELHSPAGAFGPGAFLKAVLSMDDTGVLAKDFALKPQFLLIQTFLASSSMSHARSKSLPKRLRASRNHSKARSLGKHRGELRKPPQASG